MKYFIIIFIVLSFSMHIKAQVSSRPEIKVYKKTRDGMHRELARSCQWNNVWDGNVFSGYEYICDEGSNYVGDTLDLGVELTISHPNTTLPLQNVNMPSGWTFTSETCSDVVPTSSHPCEITVNYNAVDLGEKEARFTLLIGQSPNYLPYYFRLKVKTVEPCAKCDALALGSIIGVTKQSVAERIPIVGTDFFLNYSSDYTDNYITDHHGIGVVPIFNRHLWTISSQHHFQVRNMKLYKGDGESEVVNQIRGISTRDSELLITEHESLSPDGTEIYFFDTLTGKHRHTKSSLTGAMKYEFTYSGDKLVYIDDVFGNRTTINYDGSGVVTSIVAPYGQTTALTVSGGRLVSVTNPNGETYSMTYKSGTNLLETFTKPGGEHSTFSYNINGRLIQDLGHGGNKWILTKSGTDKSGSVTQTSKLGIASIHNISHNAGSVSRSFTTPDYFTTNYTEGADGSFGVSNNIEYKSTSVANDLRFRRQFKRITSETHTIGSNTKTTTYGQAITTSVNDPRITPWLDYYTETNTRTVNSKTWTNFFDKATRTFTDTSPEGAIVTTELNAHEQLASLQVGYDTPWDYTYDGNGRLSNKKQGLNQNSLTYTYNGSGYVSSIANALSETTYFGYDLAGRVTSITLPDSRVISKTYNANGELASITPPGRPAHAFLYNAYEELSDYHPPSIGVSIPKNTTYTYNGDKKVTLITLPNSATIGFSYNSTTGKLATKTIAAGNYVYQYDSTTKQLEKIVSPNGPASVFDYYGHAVKDDEQRRNSDNYLFGKVAFTFDSEHRISSRITQPSSSGGASTINYSYNDDDELSQVGDLALTYSYPSGRLSATTIGNITDTRTYDAYGNLSTYTATYNPTSTVLYSYALTRDVTSRIIGKSENVLGTTTNYVYSYDSAGRLTAMSVNGSTTTTFTYDSNSNRTSGTIDGVAFTATYDDQDRILTYNSRTYTHNTNGYLTGIQWTPSTSSSFVYDAMGNLKQTTLTSGAVHTFDHDGLDRRVTKSIGGTLQWRAVYENNLRIAAYVNNTAGILAKEFVYATRLNVPDYMISGGVKYRIVTDHLGSPRLMVKTTDGTIAQRMDYNVLGEVKADTNPSFQPFGFAGGIYEPGVQLVRFGARDYDPRAGGRWTSKDPIGFNGGDTNLYGYVLNDPINFIDPMGLWAWPWDIYNDSAQDAADKYPNDPNGKQDAYRHCLASCRMTAENGSFLTSLLGGLNETKGDLQGQSKCERARDEFNNEMGDYLGDKNKSGGGDCATRCQGAMLR